jgi:hypothetical protein
MIVNVVDSTPLFRVSTYQIRFDLDWGSQMEKIKEEALVYLSYDLSTSTFMPCGIWVRCFGAFSARSKPFSITRCGPARNVE